jgi:hypothetical protein
LTFFAKVGLELGEHAQHVEEGLPRGSACIYRLLGGLQAGTLGLYGANNILKITDAPSLPVDPGDHQHVTGAKKIQHRLKLGSAGCCRSAALFSANDPTPRALSAAPVWPRQLHL